MFGESIQSISSETDLGVDAVFADHAFVFTELSKGYVYKALGNDVCEAWFHGRVCYCKYEKKRDEFCRSLNFVEGDMILFALGICIKKGGKAALFIKP